MSTKRDLSTRRAKQDEAATSSEDMSVSQLAQWISSKLDTTKEELVKRINEGMVSVKTEIKTELDIMRSQLDKSISDLSKSVATNSDAIQSTTSALSRSQYTNDLIVSGVPYIKDEILTNYFETWCKQLGYTSVPLVDIRRLSKQAMDVGKSYKILLQFAITNQRSDFYHKYLKARSLALDQIGFKSNDRIFINKNLTPLARAIKAKALLVKKRRKAAFCLLEKHLVIWYKYFNNYNLSFATLTLLPIHPITIP